MTELYYYVISMYIQFLWYCSSTLPVPDSFFTVGVVVDTCIHNYIVAYVDLVLCFGLASSLASRLSLSYPLTG